MQNQPQLCKQILSNHISTNTEEHKRTIVRTMRQTGVLDDDEDSDSFMDMYEFINTPIVNKVGNPENVTDLSCSDPSNK